MKNMTEFTEAQLEVMSKEKSPRGRKARMELERRKKMFNGEIQTKKVQESVQTEDIVAQEIANAPKPKRTRRKPAAKKSGEE